MVIVSLRDVRVQMESTVDLEETLQLERGQNLFEIHIQKVSRL